MKNSKTIGILNTLKNKPMLIQWIGLLLATVILFIVFYNINPRFISAVNLRSMLIQLSFLGIVSLGLTYVFISGGIDISMGSMMAFGAILPAWLMVNMGVSPLLAIVIGIFLGVIVGLINGFLHTKAGVNPLIVTLGMLSILRGLANYIGEYRQVPVNEPLIIFLGAGRLGPVSVPFILFLLTFLIMYFFQLKTRFARYMYASGANMKASLVCGIKVDKIRITAYVICAALAALAGIMMAGRSQAAHSAAGIGVEFEAIGAVVIGGTSLKGGRGSLIGTVIGVLLMVVTTNGMLIMGMEYFTQQIVMGMIIIFAIILDSQLRRWLAVKT